MGAWSSYAKAIEHTFELKQRPSRGFFLFLVINGNGLSKSESNVYSTVDFKGRHAYRNMILHLFSLAL